MRGCLGDCCRAEGDAEGTLAHYQESVRLLQAAGDDAEVGVQQGNEVGVLGSKPEL